MSECEQASRLSAYHDGEMSPVGAGRFEEHLRQCPECAAELGRLGKLSKLFGSMDLPAMPPAALQRMHRVVDVLPSLAVRRIAEAFSAVAAAILIVCALGLAWLSGPRDLPAQIPVWEAQAVTQQPPESAAGGSEELLAQWMVQDLSRKDAHD